MYGLLRIADGVSPSVSPLFVAISLVGFTAIYGVLAVADVYLLVKYGKAGPAMEEVAEPRPALALAY